MAGHARAVEVVFLPGLRDVVLGEVEERLSDVVRRIAPVPGRDDAVAMLLTGSLAPLLRLRTAVAPFLVLSFRVPRPRSLLGGDHFPAIVDAVREMLRLNRARPPQGLRIEAAGRDSPVLRTLADQVSQATRLRPDDESGECVLRLRRTPGRDGWDVLVRLTARPLSARPWRVASHPAAANATVAAAMVRLSKPDARDRVVNLMCGSGTILVERLLAGPARTALGVDLSPAAIAAARSNADAAGVTDRLRLHTGNAADDGWPAGGPYDCVYADPPWGDKSGDHRSNEQLHMMLLERSHAVTHGAARLVVLTHEIRVMERCLRRADGSWRLTSETRVFHKGHHPRIYVLQRTR